MIPATQIPEPPEGLLPDENPDRCLDCGHVSYFCTMIVAGTLVTRCPNCGSKQCVEVER